MSEVQHGSTDLISGVQEMKISSTQQSASAANFFSSLSWNDDNSSSCGTHPSEKVTPTIQETVTKEVICCS